MSEAAQKRTRDASRAALGDAMRGRVCALLESVVYQDEARAAETFDNLQQRAGDLWRRKQAMEGTKSGTRDLLGEVLFSRLRRSFREFHTDTDAEPSAEIRAAEWVLGKLFAGSALTESVEPEALALGRSRQVVKPGWARRRRERSCGDS